MSVPNLNVELTFSPNRPYDCGPNAAGCGRQSVQSVLTTYPFPGVQEDGVVKASNLRVGFNAAGMPRNNSGPNVAGAPRVWTYPEIFENGIVPVVPLIPT